MANPEQVVIDIVVNNNSAISALEKVKSKLNEIASLSGKVVSNIDKIGNFDKVTKSINNTSKAINGANKQLDDFQKKVTNIYSLPHDTLVGKGVPRNLEGRYSLPHDTLTGGKYTLNAWEQLRENANKHIKLQIDSGNVKHTTEQVNQLNKVLENSRSSFMANVPPKPAGFELIGRPYGQNVFSPAISSQSSGALVPSNTTTALNDISKSYNSASKSASDFGKKSADAGQSASSYFHQFNNLLITIGGQFSNLATSIAGLFGANSLGGMFEKMWKGAADRQTNMLYLIHQKGVSQANAYYDEIMDIVTQLPGDDTFLTNILNMSAAMDKNIKVDNLKELGTAITDFYIASTMKGELPFETERDIRKYMATGDTRGLRNSLLAGELDLLKEKNSVLERGQALQKALENTGFTGMSQYDSAINELEEFKGHFQKAFADLGQSVIAVTQPLLKFYNAIDTAFGSRVSQMIIMVAVALIGLFTVIGTGMIITSVFFRILETVGMAIKMIVLITEVATSTHSVFNAILRVTLGLEEEEIIAKNAKIGTTIRECLATLKNTLANELYVASLNAENISIWSVVTALGSYIKAKLVKILTTIKEIILGYSEITLKEAEATMNMVLEGSEVSLTDAKKARRIMTINNIRVSIISRLETAKSTVENLVNALSNIIHSKSNIIDASTEEINTLAKESNTIATLVNAFSKIQEMFTTLRLVGAIIVATLGAWLNTEATFSEAYAHVVNTAAKYAETEATYGLATAMGILDVLMSPIVLTILLIVGAVIALVIVVEKLGEAFGWWKDFGSMFQAIGDGINRIWNAFMNSDVVQGIIQYFGDFIATIQDVIKSIQDMFGALFGFGDSGSFDIVQTIIDMFGKLGDIVMWVWNILDDWSNSPLGIITWLNPLGILIFHLDELGSFFEDVRDAIDRFVDTPEFQELIEAWNEAITALQEPFQEIWSLINEIIGMFSDMFSDPEGEGTEDRINFLVEILKGLAFLIKVTVIPAIKAIAFTLRIVLTPLRVILTVVKAIVGLFGNLKGSIDGFGQAISNALNPLNMINSVIEGIRWIVDSVVGALTSFFERDDVKQYTIPIMNYLKRVYDLIVEWSKPFKPIVDWIFHVINVLATAKSYADIFGESWKLMVGPIEFVKNLIASIGSIVTKVEDTIKNSFIGKALGWDKDDKNDENNDENKKNILTGSIDKIKSYVENANISPLMKNQMLGELDKQKLTNGNVNDVKNLGQSYNQTNNQRQVIVNQNFSEGSMPIDARNMTKKEARSMFIGAFGYRRAVGYNGILR